MFHVSIGDDKLASIRHIYNPNISELFKHVDVKYQFLVGHLRKGKMNPHFVPTKKVIAEFDD